MYTERNKESIIQNQSFFVIKIIIHPSLYYSNTNSIVKYLRIIF